MSRIESWKSHLLSTGAKLTLLKSVLNSITLHTLAILSPPKASVKIMQNAIARFLWDSPIERHHKWVNNKRMMTDFGNGGIGVEKIENLIEALHTKLSWNYIEESSLWATYMQSKYKRFEGDGHLYKASNVWKVIQPKLQGLYDEAIKITTPFSNLEKWYWKPKRDEKFSMKVWLKLKHHNRAAMKWAENLWHQLIPPKWSILIWKIIQIGLPLDENLKRIGIQMASRCWCCADYHEESDTHLFINSEIAKSIWSYLGKIFRVQINSTNMIHFVKVWILGADMRTQYGFIRVLIVCCSLFEIWKLRNCIRHDEASQNRSWTLQKIIKQTQILNKAFCPSRKSSKLEIITLLKLDLLVHRGKVESVTWFKWNPPSDMKIKLNFDGAWKSETAAIGGVFRDHKGRVIASYIGKMMASNAEQVEALALLWGLKSAKELNLDIHIAEGDSQNLIHYLNSRSGGNCTCFEFIIECLPFANDIVFQHTVRQGNRLADLLAKEALNNEVLGVTWKLGCEMSRRAKAVALEDELGLLNYRKKISH